MNLVWCVGKLKEQITNALFFELVKMYILMALGNVGTPEKKVHGFWMGPGTQHPYFH